jgi:orotidine-5'-phosphate decarboxylase
MGGTVVMSLDNMDREEVQGLIQETKEWSNEQVLSKFNDLLSFEWMTGVKEIMKELEDSWIETELLQLMLDPKWNDIPNTIQNYLTKLDKSGLAAHTKLLTLMASGWYDMMKAAVTKRDELGLSTKLLAVTVLTTLGDKWSHRVYGDNVKHAVLKLAKDALAAGMDWIVCSPQEATMLRGVFGDDFLIVTPGIRMADNNVTNDDQHRIDTPDWAIRNGSTHLVIGRPITQATDKAQALTNILSSIDEVQRNSTDKNAFAFEKALYNWSMEDVLKYIGAIYIKPENGSYVRLASGLLSNGYVNIGVAERNPYVLERASSDLAEQVREKNINADVIMWAQMGSIRLSSHLAKSLWVEQSIYTEKTTSEAIDKLRKDLIDTFTRINTRAISENGIKESIDDMINDYKINSNGMKLDRHDTDLFGKRVIISEDVITKATTTNKMIEIVQQAWGTVVWITCLANRSGMDNIDGIPLFTTYTPAPFELYYDENTPQEAIKNNLEIPTWSRIIEKPKASWNVLVQSMRN